MVTKNLREPTNAQKKLSLRSALGLAARIAMFAIPVFTAPSIGIAASNILFVDDFENGNLFDWAKDLCCQHSAQIVNFPTRAGPHALKFTLDEPSNGDKVRAEIALGSVPANSERWYGFSVLVPQDYKNDPSDEIITQWHNPPDKERGEEWNGRGPTLSLRIKDDQFILYNSWDSNPVSEGRQNFQKWNLANIPKGQWTDWVVRVKWSYQSDGMLEVWQNDKLVVRKTGPNTYNDLKGPFLKMGIYKSHWGEPTFDQRVLYFDEVRIGDASVSYQDVAPQGSPLPKEEPPTSAKVSKKVISENFASSATNLAQMAGKWDVSEGKYNITGPVIINGTGNGNISVHNQALSGDFTITADASVEPTSKNWDDFSLIFNYQDRKNYYYASFNESDNSKCNGIFKVSGGNVVEVVDFASQITAGKDYNIKVERTGRTIKVYRDSALQAEATDSSLRNGKVGFGSANNAAIFDNLVVEQ